MIAEKVYASEGCRWYDKRGTSVHEYVGKNGKTRKPTLREARDLEWTPSVTSILQIIAKPELENWKLREVAKTCGYSMIGEGETEDEYAARMVEKAKENMSKGRETGTEVHGMIDEVLFEAEQAWRHPMETFIPRAPCSAHTKAASNALKELGVWGQPFEVEKSFCSFGVAGKVDIRSGDSARWIGDWKTTSKTLEDGKPLEYDEYVSQLAAYCMGVYGELVPCWNCFLSTSNPGAYVIKEWSKEELKRGWEMFEACRRLWIIKNRYDFLNRDNS